MGKQKRGGTTKWTTQGRGETKWIIATRSILRLSLKIKIPAIRNKQDCLKQP